MKTSSLIITYADLLTTGGHNLSSKISRVNSMTNYKRRSGNYTPTDYERPAATEPVAEEAPPPTGKKTVATKPASKAQPSKKKSASTTTPVKSKPSDSRAANIRPRSAVISTAPRRTRGL